MTRDSVRGCKIEDNKERGKQQRSVDQADMVGDCHQDRFMDSCSESAEVNSMSFSEKPAFSLYKNKLYYEAINQCSGSMEQLQRIAREGLFKLPLCEKEKLIKKANRNKDLYKAYGDTDASSPHRKQVLKNGFSATFVHNGFTKNVCMLTGTFVKSL